ncbi:MAG TPA: hypothetical protein VN961_15340 [Streptosporangiaceae bacterium]|nr:hypothetical protein [Streptosporangiaceae bacterium]
MKAAARLRARQARDRFRHLRFAFKAAARIHAAGDMGALTMALWPVYTQGIQQQVDMAGELWRRFGPP